MNETMKRMYSLALGIVLSGLTAGMAFAQGEAFPDTPENHWAYEALANMRKAGLLVGYPDGLYRGARPASRYEMAVALHALYQYLRNLADGYDARIKAIEGGSGGMSPDQLNEIREMLKAVQADVAGMKAWGDDIANLKRMASTFEKELASQGVDIEALKKGLNDLAERVSRLEKIKPAVDLHGNLGLWLGAGYSDDGEFGITVDGRPTGVGEWDGDPSSSQRDVNILHGMTFVASGTNDEGPKWKAALSINNMLGDYFFDGFSGGSAFGNLSNTLAGIPFDDKGNTDVYFQELSVSDKTAFAGQSFSYKAGRVGHQVGSYFLKRPDTTPYYKDSYFDDGNWYFDGAVLMFNFGAAELNIFGGRQHERNTTNSVALNPMVAGASTHIFEPGGMTGGNPDRPRGLAGGEMTIDQHIGATFGVPLGSRGKINLVYIILDSNEIVTMFNGEDADRVNVLGGDVMFKINDQLNLFGGYSQTNVMIGDNNVIDSDNAAWWAGLGYERDNWGINFGYRQIDPLFYAPGSWGRLGIWWNPTDIEGFWAKANIKLGDNLTLHGSGEFYKGSETSIGVSADGGSGTEGLSNDDKITSFKIGLMYDVSSNFSVHFGAEMVKWDLASRGGGGGSADGGFSGGETEENWYNIGVNYRMSDKAWWSLSWQISDYDSKGTAGMNPFPSFFSGSGKAKGGLITSTLGIRF